MLTSGSLPCHRSDLLLTFLNGLQMYAGVLFQAIGLIILLGTGLRISELCGLTETDLDFENRVINVDRRLLWCAEIVTMVGKRY